MFHTVGAAIEKRLAEVLDFDAGTTSSPWFDERNVQTDMAAAQYSGSQVDHADAP